MNTKKENLNVIYSSDDNYCIHMGVSILSILENNKKVNNINIYIIENNISKKNKEKLIDIVKSYNQKIIFINFDKYKQILNLNMEWDISISAYARLFICSMLPSSVDKILYFDCDTLILDDLTELWNMDIDNFYIGGVCDTVPSKVKKAIGLNNEDFYINSGMLLINLKKWRDDSIENKFLEFIKSNNGNVCHHDQGVINGVLKKKKILPLKYNLMTSYCMMTREEIIEFYNVEDNFYNEIEIQEALKYPLCIHYTPGFTTRPWIKGCKHPYVNLYWKYIELTPWNDLKPMKNNDKLRIKLVNWIYMKIPFKIANKIYKFVMNILKRG